MDMKYPRNKTDNLNNKVNAIATLQNTHMMSPEDILDIVDITSDNAEVIARGEAYWDKQDEGDSNQLDDLGDKKQTLEREDI